jgi:hypothetical protein
MGFSRMSAAKSTSGAVKSIPDIATLILATLIETVGCRRIHPCRPQRHAEGPQRRAKFSESRQ